MKRTAQEKLFFGFAAFLLTAIFTLSGCPVDDDSPPPSYNIGDVGPAGGFIFHVADNDGTYTYYEAAPTDCDTAVWGKTGSTLGTELAIGTGKSNTAKIIADNSPTETAASLCDAYSSGGKDDWFLPSQGELKAMLLNLDLKGLGGFAQTTYWCSSEVGPAHYAGAINFNTDTGAMASVGRGSSLNVRAVRSFN